MKLLYSCIFSFLFAVLNELAILFSDKFIIKLIIMTFIGRISFAVCDCIVTRWNLSLQVHWSKRQLKHLIGETKHDNYTPLKYSVSTLYFLNNLNMKLCTSIY